MANKILVEIIPALNQNTSSEDCCESKESECCNSIDVNLEEVQNIKKRLQIILIMKLVFTYMIITFHWIVSLLLKNLQRQ